jgi:GNAT superfamily N-acetyltransferase
MPSSWSWGVCCRALRPTTSWSGVPTSATSRACTARRSRPKGCIWCPTRWRSSSAATSPTACTSRGSRRRTGSSRAVQEQTVEDHEAIVALDVDRPQHPGVGVARYIREPYEPEIAEAAITVADEYHGLGAGTLLLGALAARARDNGIVVFRNYVLEGNDAMLQVFDDLGARREREPEGLWRVDLDLPDDEQLPASGASRAFVEVARDDRGLISLVPPIWGRWRRSMKARSEDVDQDEQDDDAIPQDDLDRWLRRRGDR